LQGVELVAGFGDGLAVIEAQHPHGHELAQQGAAVVGHAGANARDHGIEIADDGATAVMNLGLFRIQLYIAVADIEKHHVVAALATRFHQALIAVQLRVAGHHGNFQPALGKLCRVVMLAEYIDRHLAEAKTGIRVHQQAAAHGFDIPGIVAEGQGSADHIALFSLAGGTAHSAAVHHRGIALHQHLAVALQRVDLKTHPQLAVRGVGLDIEGMEGRGFGARVDAGLDGRNIQGGEVTPLLIANDNLGAGLLNHAVPGRVGAGADYPGEGTTTAICAWFLLMRYVLFENPFVLCLRARS